MVTNINLANSGEQEEKRTLLSGQTTLIISFLLLFITLGVYGAVKFMSSRYLKIKNEIEAQISSEKAKLDKSSYADLTDFQSRLNILDQIISNHSFLETYMKSFSRYVLPNVKISKLSWDSTKKNLDFEGTAPNFDILSRQLILLKSNPSLEFIELQEASKVLSSEDGSSFIQFQINTIISKDSFN